MWCKVWLQDLWLHGELAKIERLKKHFPPFHDDSGREVYLGQQCMALSIRHLKRPVTVAHVENGHACNGESDYYYRNVYGPTKALSNQLKTPALGLEVEAHVHAIGTKVWLSK